jgi:hypothetical protein
MTTRRERIAAAEAAGDDPDHPTAVTTDALIAAHTWAERAALLDNIGESAFLADVYETLRARQAHLGRLCELLQLVGRDLGVHIADEPPF